MDTARDFELILLNGTLVPEKLSVSNATVIKGKKTLMIHCEVNPDTKHWDEVILLSISAPTLRQSSKRLTLHPASNSQAHAEGITNVMPVAVFWFSSQ